MVSTAASRHRRLIFASLFLLLFAFSAAAQNVVPAAGDERSTLWFVELSSPPTADGSRLATVKAEKAAFRQNAKSAGLAYDERYAFDMLFNGLSVRIDRSQTAALSRIAGVKAIWPVQTMYTDTGGPSETDLASALAMTGADIVQSELGFTGAGVKVGIIDTGVDYHHPDLGGCFGDDCRVARGWDFVGDAYDSTIGTLPVSDPDPDDCNGHGTHVAGIVGANGVIKGVAPGVTFGAYRVFGCTGTTDADVMIAAMERAMSDGMQVVNISIGSAFQWPQYPTAMAATRLVNRGVVVVASIGNSGANGVWGAGAPGVGEKVIGVASFNNTHVSSPKFTVSPDEIAIAYSRATGAPPPPPDGTFPMARTGTTSSAADACNANAPAPGSLYGQIALIRRGTCGFNEKASNAQNAGAVGVVLYNNVAGTLSPSVVGAFPITIPVVGISGVDGVLIDGRIAAGGAALTWTDAVVTVPNPTGGLISSSSSWGLAPDLTLKPDLGAPGGSIYSTYPLEIGRYASLSGTSMASPHVAGAAALLLQARPKTPPLLVRTLLQNSGVPKLWWGNPSLGYLDQVHRQGAGMLRIDEAILSTTKLVPSKLDLGECEAGPVIRTITLDRKAADGVTYELSHESGLATLGTFAISYFFAPASVTFSSPTVSVPARGTASVDVTIVANPELSDRALFGGYIVFTPQGGGLTHRVPYSGLKGDYQSIQVLAPTANGFPWLATAYAGSYYNVPGGATYSMTGTDLPFFLVHLEHQSRLLRIEIFEAATLKSWFRAYDEAYLPRNSTASSFFAFPWDGMVMNGKKIVAVPDGQYLAKLSVLKALGDASNPAHWESWTSPVITIDRP
jgi:minor extracellular serine protease Vpr